MIRNMVIFIWTYPDSVVNFRVFSVVADIALICPTFLRCQTSETFPEVRGHVAVTREKPLNGKKSLFTRLEHGSLQFVHVHVHNITTARKIAG